MLLFSILDTILLLSEVLQNRIRHLFCRPAALGGSFFSCLCELGFGTQTPPEKFCTGLPGDPRLHSV